MSPALVHIYQSHPQPRQGENRLLSTHSPISLFTALTCWHHLSLPPDKMLWGSKIGVDLDLPESSLPRLQVTGACERDALVVTHVSQQCAPS